MKRADLYAAVWEKPVTQLAQDWGLSDTGVRGICKRHDVPMPRRGYWQKKKAGQELPPKQSLPGDPDVDIEIEIAPPPSVDLRTAVSKAPAIDQGEVVAPKALRAVHLDLSLDLALLERDAMAHIRRRGMEDLLAEIGALLALKPALNEDAWGGMAAAT